MAARVILRQRKSENVDFTRYNAHWLPVIERGNFKVLLYTYKASIRNMGVDVSRGDDSIVGQTGSADLTS